MTKKKTTFKPGKFDLRVKRSRAGLGLFTQSPIKKGECIIEYKGKQVPRSQQEYNNSKYLFWTGKHTMLDGATRANTARYINHSCRPNCEIDIHRGRVFVLARRTIKPGEELAYDYDTEYFDRYIKPHGCRCLKCKPV